MDRDFPLIDWAAQQIQLNGRKDIYLFGVQHLSYTTARMLKAMVQSGFPAENIFLHGKCYSTNPHAVKMLEDLGVSIAPQSSSFNSHLNYDQQLAESIKNYFYPLINRYSGKKIVLDDGAELLKLVMELIPNDEVVAIEQTSAGYHRAKAKNMPFPIINVARTNIKLTQESSFITRMICRKTEEAIAKFFPDTSDLKMLILGGGAIGSGVRKNLEKRYKTDTFDLQAALSDISREHFDSRLMQYDVFIGCTGNCSIPKEKHKLLKPGSLLISASSSDREFDCVELRKNVPIYSDCHRTIQTQGVSLLNSGFPVNFDETYLDSGEFQLTRALLLSAIAQAIKTSPSQTADAFIPLENSEEISQKYRALFATTPTGDLLKSPHEIEFSLEVV